MCRYTSVTLNPPPLLRGDPPAGRWSPREVDRTPPPVGRSLGGGRCVTTDPSLGPCPCREPPQRSLPLLLSEPNRHSAQASKSPVSLCKLVTQRRRLEPARLTYVYVEHPRGVGRPDCACRRSVQSLWQRSSSTQYARIVPSDDYTQNCDRDTSPPPSPHTGLIGSTWAGTLTSLCSDPTLSFSRAQPLRTRSDYTGGEGACVSSISRD